MGVRHAHALAETGPTPTPGPAWHDRPLLTRQVPLGDVDMSNITAEIKGKTLVITLDLQTPAPSASGKTLVVASSHGNVATTAVVDGKPVTIGVNAYIRK